MAYNTTTRKITAPVSIHDVQQALGVDSPDLATLCTSEAINPYAAHKPYAFGDRTTPSDIDVNYGKWGISFNTTPKLGVEKQDPYWNYTRPADGQWKRLTDFDGYNANAVPPLKATRLSVTNSTNVIGVDVNNIIDDDAEIPLLGTFGVFGIAIWGRVTERGWFYTTATHWSDVEKGVTPGAGNMSVEELPLTNGETVDVFLCAYPQDTRGDSRDDADKPLEWVEITSGTSAVALIAVDETHGHATFRVVKFSIDKLRFSGLSLTIDRSNGYRFTAFRLEVNSSYNGTGRVTFWVVIGGNRYGETNYIVLNGANTVVSNFIGPRYTEDQALDDNYIVKVEVHARITGSTGDSVIARGWCDVWTGMFST